MKQILYMLFLLTACTVVAGCATIPETPAEMAVTITNVKLTPTADRQTNPPTDTPAPATSSPVPVMQLPEEDQVIFTVPNTQSWSGKEGDPRPDWRGWGAETFTVAPDGTFWIADTAVHPNRLLHYTPQGELLQEISLEDRVVYTFDLAVDQDNVWVLDISAEQPRVIGLNLVGEYLSGVDLDRKMIMHEGEFIRPGVFTLSFGEEGELLTSGMNGYYELIDAYGKVVAQPMEALTYYGHTYKVGIYDQATARLPIFVDGVLFETKSDFFVEAEPFLGFKPDGSFALAGYVPEPDQQVDHQVRYYDARGNLLGIARQRPQFFYKDWNHHLAFGPDGSIYQLLSNPDHSVEIVRLGFSLELPPKAAVTLAVPTPLSPLLPSDTSTTDEERARNALLAFFNHLSAANYEQAVAHFGGQLEEYLRPRSPDETTAEYWEFVCSFLWCLPVVEITDVEQISESEYVFYTVFMQPDGTRFEIGACCGGDPAAMPPVWQFAFPVQKIGGDWKVMRGPLFTP